MSGSSRPARSQRGRGRPRGAQPIADRANVLEAAVRVIDRLGPDVTMDDVATESAVTKPIVYRTVGDKAALTFALSEWLVDRIGLVTLDAVTATEPPRSQFHAAVRAYLATVEEHRNVFLFVGISGQGAELTGRLVERSARGLVEILAPMRTAADLGATGARSWAYAIVGALQVSMIMWLRDGFCEVDQLAEDLTQLMWDGLAHWSDPASSHAPR